MYDKNIIDQISLWIDSYFSITMNDKKIILNELEPALSKTFFCLEPNYNKYCKDSNGDTSFSIYNSNQLTILLYYLANRLFRQNLYNNAEKIYLLNKFLNSCDLFFEIELPDYFFCEHPVGTVLGRAKYSNYFLFQQNCTIGGNKGIYPVLGEYVWFFAGATVIGNSRIGNNVFISAEYIILIVIALQKIEAAEFFSILVTRLII